MKKKEIIKLSNKACELADILDGMSDAMVYECISLVLADMDDETCRAVWKAAKSRYEGITASDVWAKVPKVSINITRN